MALHYGLAEAMEIACGSGRMYYPALNSMAAELRLSFLDKRQPVLAAAHLALGRGALPKAATQQPAFWCVAGQSGLQLR